MQNSLELNQLSLKFAKRRIAKGVLGNVSYKSRRDQSKFHFQSYSKNIFVLISIVKMAKEVTHCEPERKNKRSLYKRIRLERSKNGMNLSTEITLTNESK